MHKVKITILKDILFKFLKRKLIHQLKTTRYHPDHQLNHCQRKRTWIYTSNTSASIFRDCSDIKMRIPYIEGSALSDEIVLVVIRSN